MGAYIYIEVVFIPFIPEESVRLSQCVFADETLESVQFLFLRGKSPCVEIEIKGVVVHNVLLDS
jgi:hypothetical protein